MNLKLITFSKRTSMALFLVACILFIITLLWPALWLHFSAIVLAATVTAGLSLLLWIGGLAAESHYLQQKKAYALPEHLPRRWKNLILGFCFFLPWGPGLYSLLGFAPLAVYGALIATLTLTVMLILLTCFFIIFELKFALKPKYEYKKLQPLSSSEVYVKKLHPFDNYALSWKLLANKIYDKATNDEIQGPLKDLLQEEIPSTEGLSEDVKIEICHCIWRYIIQCVKDPEQQLKQIRRFYPLLTYNKFDALNAALSILLRCSHRLSIATELPLLLKASLKPSETVPEFIIHRLDLIFHEEDRALALGELFVHINSLDEIKDLLKGPLGPWVGRFATLETYQKAPPYIYIFTYIPIKHQIWFLTEAELFGIKAPLIFMIKSKKETLAILNLLDRDLLDPFEAILRKKRPEFYKNSYLQFKDEFDISAKSCHHLNMI